MVKFSLIILNYCMPYNRQDRLLEVVKCQDLDNINAINYCFLFFVMKCRYLFQTFNSMNIQVKFD